MQGRNKKTKEIKKLEGTYRNNRDNRPTPEGTKQMPKAPEWLSKNGKEQFEDMAETLLNLGVLRKEDKFFLSTLCAEYASYTELIEYLNEHGYTYMQKGAMAVETPKKRPEAELAATKSAFITKSLKELGLTPSARHKVSASSSTRNGNSGEDPLAQFQQLKGPQQD